MNLYVFVLDNVFDTGLAALQDTFSIANELASSDGVQASTSFATRRVGLSASVRTASGLMAPVDLAETLEPPDVAIVPAVGARTPAALDAVLSQQHVADAGAILRRWHAEGTTLAGACTGTFILAEAGLLDGKPATTSWWLTRFLRSRYPRIRVDGGRMVLDANGIITAGAALAHFDLALWLIRRESRSLASATARYLSIEDLRSTHAAYAMPDQVANHDPVVERFECWAQRNLASGFSLAAAAKAAGTSPRTLTRKLRQTLDKSPLEVFQDMRVARAVLLLRMTRTSVEEIAAEVGYADSVSLRLLLQRKLGQRISDLRKPQ